MTILNNLFVTLTIWFCYITIFLASGQDAPASPCPNVFQYYQRSNNEIYGRITLPYDGSNNLNLGINASMKGYYTDKTKVSLKIKMVTPGQEIADRRADSIVYTVAFPFQHSIPKITKIDLNSRTYCTGPPEELIPGSAGVTNLWAGQKFFFEASKNNPQNQYPLAPAGPSGEDIGRPLTPNTRYPPSSNPPLWPTSPNQNAYPSPNKPPGNNNWPSPSSQNPYPSPNQQPNSNNWPSSPSQNQYPSPIRPPGNSNWPSSSSQIPYPPPNQQPGSNNWPSFPSQNQDPPLNKPPGNTNWPSPSSQNQYPSTNQKPSNAAWPSSPIQNQYPSTNQKPSNAAWPSSPIQNQYPSPNQQPGNSGWPSQNQYPPTNQQPGNPSWPNLLSNNQYQQDQCGVSKPFFMSHILAGTDVPDGMFPWLTAMFITKELSYEYKCSGNLVSDKHVITAARCLFFGKVQIVPTESLIFVFGRSDLRNWASKGSVTRGASETQGHPDFVYDSGHADIAVVVLNQPLQFSRSIAPICLWGGSPDIREVINTRGTIAGWGTGARRPTLIQNNVLVAKSIDMPIVSDTYCTGSDGQYYSLTSNMTFCAGQMDGTGTCIGDTGAGFMIKGNDRYYLRGIASRPLVNSQGECVLNPFMVFCDVAKFSGWIATIMRKY